jgi:hypothetical protein
MTRAQKRQTAIIMAVVFAVEGAIAYWLWKSN